MQSMTVVNPILVEVTRGSRTESLHRGSIAVVDATGHLRYSAGDVSRIVFPRSTLKPLQALPLVASGASDRFGLDDVQLAITCGSHAGDTTHVAVVSSILDRTGLNASALECGTHWPLGEQAARALAAGHTEPSALHNNCSGKHAGFLCLARHRGHDTAGYVSADHPVMREVLAAISTATGVAITADCCGIDGCSIPAPALPLVDLARGFARLATASGLPPELAAAALRLQKAWGAAPDMIAGTGCFDTLVATASHGTVLTKSGAEGVATAALPEIGLGVAIKIDDGAGRAAEAVLAATVTAIVGRRNDALAGLLAARSHHELMNWRGNVVGSVDASPVANLLATH